MTFEYLKVEWHHDLVEEPRDRMMREAIHVTPVWRDRSDFIIAVEIDGGDAGVATEQLWARKVDGSHFELCCIPFFAQDLALGDIVETDGDHIVQSVTRRSGRYVLRIWFGDSDETYRQQVAERLEEVGAVLEWSSPRLLGVDAHDKSLAETISGWLRDREKEGRLVYETGWTA